MIIVRLNTAVLKSLYFVCVFTTAIFSSSHLIAQNNFKIDSLNAILSKENLEDSIQLEVLEELADLYSTKDFDKYLSYSEQLLSLSQRLDNKAKQISAYQLMALASIEKNLGFDTIMDYLNKGIELVEELNDTTEKTRIYSAMARLYMRDGFHSKSYDYYQKALVLSEQLKDTSRIIVMLNNMSLILKKEEEYESAKYNCKLALSYAERIQNNKRYKAALNNNLGAIYDKQDSIDQALPYYEKSLAIKEELSDRYSMVPTLHNIAVINMFREKYELADMQFQRGYDIASELEYVYGLGLILVGWADSARRQKKNQVALNRLLEAKNVLGKNGDLYTQMNCYEYLSLTYEALNNYESAYKNYIEFNAIQDSIYHRESRNKIVELEAMYKVQQKETENELLKAEQEVSKKEAHFSKLIALGLFIALLLALGWGYTIFQANRQKRKMNEELEKKVRERTQDLKYANQELTQLNSELKTFNYIASHDIKEPIRNIGSYVGLIQHKIPNELLGNLEYYFSTIKKSTSQLYTLVEDLSKYTSLSKTTTVHLSNVDLNEIIESLTINFGSLLKEKNGKIINHGLPIITTSSSMIFIALKHLINNGLKFNDAKEPIIEISYNSILDGHQIIISDNGIGIDAQFHDQIFEMFKRLHDRKTYEGSGIGLAIVKLMVKKINGQIKIKSKKEGGSQFIIELPE